MLDESCFCPRGDKKGNIRKVQNLCKKCVVARNKERREKNPGKSISYDLQRYFGINIDDYNKMVIEQDFKCKICGDHQLFLKRRLAVDHCHKTGKIRGLLCNACNTGLGKFKDDPTVLQSALNYINTDLADKPKVSGLAPIKK